MKHNFLVPLFDFTLFLYVGENEIEAYTKIVTKYGPKGFKLRDFIDGKCAGSYLWIRENDLGVLAHELSHFFDMMLVDGGIADPSGEIRAYFMQWAVPKMWNKISKDLQAPDNRSC